MRTPSASLLGRLTRAVPLAAALALAGCVASHRGLVELDSASAGKVHLRTPDGRSFALRSTDERGILRSLEGCTVEVSGPRLARSMVVQSWSVVDAGDGSAPYVGMLRQHGSNLVIDDRNSGMPLVLDDPSAARFGTYAGMVVMISGYVVGAQLLHVVNFRVLVE